MDLKEYFCFIVKRFLLMHDASFENSLALFLEDYLADVEICPTNHG